MVVARKLTLDSLEIGNTRVEVILSKQRINLLEKLPGWVWDVKEALWMENYFELLDFVKKMDMRDLQDQTKFVVLLIDNEKTLKMKNSHKTIQIF